MRLYALIMPCSGNQTLFWAYLSLAQAPTSRTARRSRLSSSASRHGIPSSTSNPRSTSSCRVRERSEVKWSEVGEKLELSWSCSYWVERDFTYSTCASRGLLSRSPLWPFLSPPSLLDIYTRHRRTFYMLNSQQASTVYNRWLRLLLFLNSTAL